MEKELQLTSGPVLLRPYRLCDIDHLYVAVRESIAELSVWMPWCHADYSIEESKVWIESRAEAREKGTEYDFVITDSRNGFLLGGCGLNNINLAHRFANLGYWVRSTQAGKGVATAAALLVARFGLNELKLNRIEIIAATGNKASQRVAEKVGATREGVLRNRLVVRDKVYDGVMFSIVPGDLTLGG